MKQLLLDSLALGKDVLLLRASRELYVLLAANSAAALLVGLVAPSLNHGLDLLDRKGNFGRQTLPLLKRHIQIHLECAALQLPSDFLYGVGHREDQRRDLNCKIGR